MTPRRLLKLFLMAAFVFGTGATLSACNTVEGVGEDLAAAARTVKKVL